MTLIYLINIEECFLSTNLYHIKYIEVLWQLESTKIKY